MAGVFDITTSTNGKHYFNLKAGNGQIILSSEMYESKSATENGIESVKANAPNDGRYDRLTSKSGSPYFVLKASNGQVIGKSEMYNSVAAMENGIEAVKTNAPTAVIVDHTSA
ncbi:MAG: YegP family protein [Pyrinomonadaceae bacterium]